LAESSEIENDASHESLERSTAGPAQPYRSRAFGRGIKSSWDGTRSYSRRKPTGDVPDEDESATARDSFEEESQHGKGKMVDIGLESQAGDDEPPASLTLETPTDNSPPAFQQFNPRADRTKFLLRRESTQESEFNDDPARQSSEIETMPTAVPLVDGDIFKYDPFFAWIFLIMLAGLVSTAVLVWLNTSSQDGKKRLGDTIYTTLHSSFHMLAVDTVISVMVSLVWLAALRSFVRPLVAIILVAVPVIFVSFALYPFISSFQGRTHGDSFQDKILRLAAIVPAVGAIIWVYLVFRGRHAVRQAIEILEFSSKILAANPALLFVGLASLVFIISWTWLWLMMFTRVFLGGYLAKSVARFVINISSWWLGVGFVLMYMWSVAVINSVQRATTGATVSQWYFHRNTVPAPSSKQIVTAALSHAATTIFGTICESTLLALLIRLPMLVLPSRLSLILARIINSWVPTSVAALTNPLTITYSAIHSQNLVTSSRGLSQMEFLSPNNPTTTLTPRAFSTRRESISPLLPYRLSKLLLFSTRFIMATALGFAGWVITAKQLEVTLPDGIGIRGSAYAYVVGLVASFIGYSVMGAMEGILSGIVDAAVICYGSERRMASGAGAYCMEAAYLFGDRRREVDDGDFA
jgi:hypothetical protein